MVPPEFHWLDPTRAWKVLWERKMLILLDENCRRYCYESKLFFRFSHKINERRIEVKKKMTAMYKGPRP